MPFLKGLTVMLQSPSLLFKKKNVLKIMHSSKFDFCMYAFSM